MSGEHIIEVTEVVHTVTPTPDQQITVQEIVHTITPDSPTALTVQETVQTVTVQETTYTIETAPDPQVIEVGIAGPQGVQGLAGTNGSGGGVSDHGALTGLANDDHPQYAALAQNEVVTGLWSIDNAEELVAVAVPPTPVAGRIRTWLEVSGANLLLKAIDPTGATYIMHTFANLGAPPVQSLSLNWVQ